MNEPVKFMDEYQDALVQFAEQLDVSPEVHQDDFIFRFLIENPVFENKHLAIRYYFHDGRNSAEQLKTLMLGLGLDVEKQLDLLEFASGYGCVTRHMSNVVPSVQVTACDVHDAAVQFIQDRLGCGTMLSHVVPEEFEHEATYDMVFALSFFSHMPETTWGRWLQVLLERVVSGGYLAFTTQGPVTGRKFMSVPELPESGFWFKAASEQKDLDVEDYGQTLVSQAYVEASIDSLPNATLTLIRPAYWWGHQDLYVVQKS